MCPKQPWNESIYKLSRQLFILFLYLLLWSVLLRDKNELVSMLNGDEGGLVARVIIK